MQLPDLRVTQWITLLLVGTVLAFQILAFLIDLRHMRDVKGNELFGNGPAVLLQKARVIGNFPVDQRPTIARSLSTPVDQMFIRDVPGLHPSDQLDTEFAGRAMNWMRAQGVPVAELIIAQREFNEMPDNPPPGVEGRHSTVLKLGAPPPTVLMDDTPIVPAWVSGDWASADPSGTAVPTSDPLTGPPRADAKNGPAFSPPPGERNGSADVLTFALRLEGEETWVTLYRLFFTQTQLNTAITRTWMTLLGTSALAAIAVIIARWMTGPLRDLARSAEKVSHGARPEPIPVRGPRDTREIITTYNRMHERIDQTMDYQMALLHSLGHDLKGPLATVDRLLDTVGPDEDRDRIRRRLKRMQDTVDSIMGVSRAILRDGDHEPTDLAALVQAVVDEQADLGHEASAVTPDRLILSCRGNAIERCIQNLVENALKYGGSVRAELSVRRDAACLRILDEGPGIPETALDAVFEPFLRLGSDKPGTGLGLAIAQTVAVDHGGSIRLSNRATGGLCAELRLPLTSHIGTMPAPGGAASPERTGRKMFGGWPKLRRRRPA